MFHPDLEYANSFRCLHRNVEIASLYERSAVLHRHENRATIVWILETEPGSEWKAAVSGYGGVVHVEPSSIAHGIAVQFWTKPAHLHDSARRRHNGGWEGKEQNNARK